MLSEIHYPRWWRQDSTISFCFISFLKENKIRNVLYHSWWGQFTAQCCHKTHCQMLSENTLTKMTETRHCNILCVIGLYYSFKMKGKKIINIDDFCYKYRRVVNVLTRLSLSFYSLFLSLFLLSLLFNGSHQWSKFVTWWRREVLFESTDNRAIRSRDLVQLEP